MVAVVMPRISSWLLGPPGRQRWRVRMTLLAFGIFGVFAVLQHVEVLLGFIDARASAWLTSYCLTGTLVFYLLIRSGWSVRLSSDPSLAFWQILHGVVATVWSYAITGPARGAVLAILVLLLAFSMFGLSVKQSRQLVLGAGVALAVTMAWKSHTDPLGYPPLVEAVGMAFAVIVLTGVSVLSVRMGALRERLRQQKQELEASLAQIRVLATQDELTGLVNRRHVTTLLQGEQLRQQRSGQSMGVVLLDLDHFKRINDSYGHQAGDAALRTFTRAVQPLLRGADVLARWGGEEFLLMLPETGEKEALNCIQRMREGLARASFDAIAPGLRLTFSAGLTVCQAGDSIEAKIELADQALYRAKEAGRNCTVSA